MRMLTNGIVASWRVCARADERSLGPRADRSLASWPGASKRPGPARARPAAWHAECFLQLSMHANTARFVPNPYVRPGQKEVVVIGGGFAGLNAARALAGREQVHVTIVDARNHHLFQPLLYQVATAGLSPADIAVPIRSIFRSAPN